ncbi:MAG TPA: cbb3-type cytochrome c oxidase subunit 3 [Pseudobdellovibrionaceae bacterium]|jgi:cbb3-type cytochrome oxidase subunit 3
MTKEAFSYFTDTQVTSLGLIIFFVFFMGVLCWTSLKANKAIYKDLEQLPLKEGN